MSRPHLIILMADQLRFDLVGEHTPNISALMAESTTFSRAYCASPLCVPARGAFFTGRYPNENGSLINPWEKAERVHGLVRAGIPNLYTMLEEEWDSWHTGKQHLLTADGMDDAPETKTNWLSLQPGYHNHLDAQGKHRPGGPAFRSFMPEMAYGTTTRTKKYSIPTTGCYEYGLDDFFDGYIKNTSLEAIDQRDPSKPFMLNAMFIAPHPPYDIPEPFYSYVRDVPMPENVGMWGAGQSPLQLYNLTGFLGSRYSREDWQEPWDVYTGLVHLLDHCIGEIVQRLKDEGLYDDALIVWTADHGEMLGSHCLWQKMCMYEESTHVPLSFKLPKGNGQVESSDALVSHIDVLPTLCDLLDVPIPDLVTGRSLRSTIEDGSPLDRDHLFIQFDGNGARGNFQRSVVRGRHRLIVDLFKDETFFELYDVIDDPQEKANLAFDEVGATRELTSLLIDWMHDTDDLIAIDPGAYDRFLNAYTGFRQTEPTYPVGPAAPHQIARS